MKHPRIERTGGIASYGRINLKNFGADSFQEHNEIMGTDPKQSFTTPFSTVMDEVKNALEQKGFRTNIPDSDLSSIC
ncbi:hypothetical protein [Neobacillus sp. CF12]|uniref:hypothetical protein n=1 Tax=Neobacillus sp. CF12 TaxID=3055864 RepID=UPI0025A1D400|nr:hypothetical protein [Neobacillus sp. CF12]MDM5328634.1 hypothetical protein [Neobacillus sp. CF12]